MVLYIINKYKETIIDTEYAFAQIPTISDIGLMNRFCILYRLLHKVGFMKYEFENIFGKIQCPIYISNIGSYVSQLYQLKFPYSITYEISSQKDGDSTVSIFMLSPGSHMRYHTEKGDDSYNFILSRSLHQHDFWELMYVLEGNLKQYIENTCNYYSKGSCCLINRNIKHKEEFTTDFQAIFLSISDEFMQDMSEHFVKYLADGTFIKCDSKIYRVFYENQHCNTYYEKDYLDFLPIYPDSCHMEEIKEIFDTILLETINQKPGFIYMVKALSSRLFSMLENPDIYRLSHFKPISSYDDILYVRIAHLLEARHGRINRAELEKILNYNGDHLNRVLKKHSGMTLVEYGQDICLKESADLLRTTDISISDIIRSFGFSNRTYFNRIFKGKYGVTPKEYRDNKNRSTIG